MNSFYELTARWAQAGYIPAMFEHAFMIRGLLAALLIGPMLGAVGTLVVSKRLVFFIQTVGHASLTGVALGLLLGEPLGQTYGGLYGFCILIALLMLYIKNRTRASADTVVGVVLAQILGLGIVMLVLVTKQFNIHQVEAVLFGSLITINDEDIVLLAATAGLVAASLILLFNAAMLISFNPIMARARGLDAVLLDYVFVVVATLVVVASLKMIGALLVLVLIVIPAAAAQNLAVNLRGFFWSSVVFATISSVIGLLISGVWPIPTGGAIVLIASLLFYGTLLLKPFLGRSPVQQGDV